MNAFESLASTTRLFSLSPIGGEGWGERATSTAGIRVSEVITRFCQSIAKRSSRSAARPLTLSSDAGEGTRATTTLRPNPPHAPAILLRSALRIPHSALP